MAQNQIRNPEKEFLWRDRLSRQKASGLSQQAFCDQEGLSPNSFSSWKKEIHRRDIDANNVTPGAKKIASKKTSKAPPKTQGEAGAAPTSESAFVPVVFAGSSRPSRKVEPIVEIRLHLATLVVFAGADSETLRAVITACRELWY